MPDIHQYFRGQILGCSAESKCSALSDFSKSKVCEFKVPVSGYQDILRLEVPVDDILAVQILKDGNYLSRIEPRIISIIHGLVRLEGAFLPQVREKLTARHELHEHVEISWVLSKAIEVNLVLGESYHEGVGDGAEDAVLVVDVVHLLRVDDVLLLHDLNARVFVGAALLDQPHLAECA
jgi:hypothetical protein